MGMLIKKFICEDPRADNIMMFDFEDCAEKYHCQPWRVPVTGSDEFFTMFSEDTPGMLYG